MICEEWAWLPISLRAPSLIPAGLDQECGAAYLRIMKRDADLMTDRTHGIKHHGAKIYIE